jgi:hypothetical protein
VHLAGKPGFLAGQHQVLLELRIGLHQPGKGADQPDLILARLQVAHGKHERRGDLEALAHHRRRRLARHRPELRRRRVGHHHHFVFVQIAVDLEDGRAGKLAAGQNLGGPVHGAPHAPLQLPGAIAGEVLRMLQKADVVNAHHHRNGARQRRRVLHVQQVGAVAPHLHGQVQPKTHERIGGDSPGLNVSRDTKGGTLRRHVGNELVVLVLGGKCVQETPNVDLITREVAADGVSINGETH